MDCLQLEYFRKVAELEHVTKAAEELNISQPSVSLAIRRMETELGVSLFDRKGRSVQLNHYGKAFLNRVQPALDYLEDGRKELQRIKTSEEITAIMFLMKRM